MSPKRGSGLRRGDRRRRVGRTAPLSNLIETEVAPGPDAVVGLDRRVRGVAGLSVIDASIATNVTTVAEHLSARLN